MKSWDASRHVIRYLENVRIQDLSTGYNSVFPVNRWIHADTVLRISEHNYFLPHQDKYPEQRSMELENMREQYKLVSKVPGIPKQVNYVRWVITDLRPPSRC